MHTWQVLALVLLFAAAIVAAIQKAWVLALIAAGLAVALVVLAPAVLH